MSAVDPGGPNCARRAGRRLHGTAGSLFTRTAETIETRRPRGDKVMNTLAQAQQVEKMLGTTEFPISHECGRETGGEPGRAQSSFKASQGRFGSVTEMVHSGLCQ